MQFVVMRRIRQGLRKILIISVQIDIVLGDAPEPGEPMRVYGMDEDGISTLDFNLLIGENFSGLKSKDSTSIFLNETAAGLYGGEKIIGEWITLTNEEEDTQFIARVIGIIEDFHYRSLHDVIGPVVIGYYLNTFEGLDDIVIKIVK